MSFKKIIVSGGIGAFLLFTGCQQASVNPISQIDDSSNTPEQSIEAVKLENPYTTEAMLRARDSLEAQGVLSKTKYQMIISSQRITTFDSSLNRLRNI